MSSSPMEVADVVEALKANGFLYQRVGQDGWLLFSGELKAAGSAYNCTLELSPDLNEVPRVRLNQLPSTLPAVLPHLGASGQLCYLAKGSVVFDMFDPVGQTLASISQAEHVLAEAPADIRIEFRRGNTSALVSWPVEATSTCVVWMRELLR